mmetsp:Transcript_9543/g.41196  ORF Transcript_9543/g.41196 Transcript_9543/m.41196 type:complete len:113 (-) Transcript_9543:1992-2330(-)
MSSATGAAPEFSSNISSERKHEQSIPDLLCASACRQELGSAYDGPPWTHQKSIFRSKSAQSHAGGVEIVSGAINSLQIIALVVDLSAVDFGSIAFCFLCGKSKNQMHLFENL